MASNEGFSVNENKSEVSSISTGAVNNDPKKLGIENGVDVVVEVVVVAAVVVEIAVVGLVLKDNVVWIISKQKFSDISTYLDKRENK